MEYHGEIEKLGVVAETPPAIDVNDTDILWLALKDNSIVVVKEWVKAGGDIECKDSDGNTPLTFALRNKEKDIAKFLLESGANPATAGAGDYAPIMCAISYGTGTELFEQLLNDDRVDLNHQDKDGDTPLMEAVTQGKYDIVMALLDKGADPYIQDYGGDNLLDTAKQSWNVEALGYLKKRIHPLYNGFIREGMDSVSTSEKQIDGTTLKQSFNFRAGQMVTTMLQKDAPVVIAETRRFHEVPRKLITDAQQALKHMKGMQQK